MKKLPLTIAASVLALSATSAMAGQFYTTTVSDSFGTLNSVTDVGVGFANPILSLPTFGQVIIDQGITAGPNQSIVLDSIHFVVNGAISNQSDFTNNSAVNANGRVQVRIDSSTDWDATVQGTYGTFLSGGGTGTYTFANADAIVLSESTTGFPAGFPVAPGATHTFSHLNHEIVHEMDAVDLIPGPIGVLGADQFYSQENLAITSGMWFNTGTFDTNFIIFAGTSIQANAQSGTGSFNQNFATGTWGNVSIVYDYDIVNDPITAPAPETLAMMALGLFGLGLRARSKK